LADEKHITGAIKTLMFLGKFVGMMVALCTAMWFFGEPFLEDYVESHFEEYDSKKEAEYKHKESQRISFRSLLSDKMSVDNDEVHIELGRLYKSEKIERKAMYNYIDSIYKKLKKQIDADYSHSARMRKIIKKEIKLWNPKSKIMLKNN